ncbi:transporter [Thermococcus sp. M39]|uniref:AEC family transporter n=1 Tax=Thermococcus sp. M39 TaxID=1638262 RepID=UPI00143B292E|nr:AEC family transporter [Thermococcus sp. M39]NJE07609.1 transporter [Thermococcus sp. M39]
MNIPEMLSLIIVGFLLKRMIKSRKPFSVIRFLASDVLLAFYVFSNVASKDLEYLMEIKVVFMYVFLIIGVSLVGSYLYGLRLEDKKWRAALMILSIYPNTVALGFPIASLFLEDLTPAIIYASTNTLIVLPISSFIAAHYSSGGASLKETVKRALRFPPVTANLLALVLVIGRINLPSHFLDILHKIGWWSIPLILVYFGSTINLRKFEIRKLLEVAAFRIVLPFVFVFLTLNAPKEIFWAVLVEASMPPAIVANVILAQYKLKEEESIGVTIVLTLLVILLFVILRVLL